MGQTYLIETPDGETWEVEGPDNATDEQIIAFAKSQVQAKQPGNTSPIKLNPPRSVAGNLALGAGGVVQGAGDMLGVISNPVNALLNATGLPQSISGQPFGTDLGRSARDASGLPYPENDDERLADSMTRGGTAGLITGGSAMLAAPLASAGSTASGVLSRIGMAPALDTVSGMFSGAGGEFARQAGLGAAGQIGASLLGGMVPVGAAAWMANLARPRSPSPVMAAADRQNITMLPADVGGTGTRMAQGVVGKTLGGIPIAEAADSSITSAANARNRVASSVGTVMADETGAGQAAQRGAKAFIKSSEERGSELYRKIPVAPDRDAVLTNTTATLNELTAGLKSNPALSKLVTDSRLKDYQDAIAGGKLSWEDLQSFRSFIGEKAGSPSMQSDISQKALKQLYAGLSRDMEATARAEGPQALSAFKHANQYWRGRQNRIEGVLTDVLGKDFGKGEAQAFEQINRWAQKSGGDFKKLAIALRSMPEDEANSVRATVLSRLGQASPARQNPDGLQFSPAEFATQWQKMSGRGKSVLFPNSQHRADINDIVLATDAMKRAGQFTNFSNTSLGTNAIAHIMGFFANPFATAGIAGAEFGAGKLLASPAFARWVARGPKIAPTAQKQYVAQLAKIAAREPAISNDVLSLQKRLEESFANQPQAAAAQEDQGQ